MLLKGGTTKGEDSQQEHSKQGSLNQIPENIQVDRGTADVTATTNEDAKDCHTATMKGVNFAENISEEKRLFKPVSRSQTFVLPGKDNDQEIGTKETSGGSGISRSSSFGGMMRKKHQPPKPSPPTFFLEENKTDVVVSEELEKDDIVKVEDTSTSQESKKWYY